MPFRARFIALGLLALVSTSATPPVAGAADYRSPLDLEQIEEFAAQHPDEDLLILEFSMSLDLEYRPKADGYFGRMEYTEEYAILTQDGVQEAQLLYHVDSDQQRFDKLRVEVLRADGKVKGLDDGDLSWQSEVSREAGVYLLDAIRSAAHVPDLSPGDRLRVVTRYKLEGVHGISAFQFGLQGYPILYSQVSLKLPKKQTAKVSLRGEESLAESLAASTSDDGTLVWQLWDIPAAPDPEALSGGLAPGILRWMAHVIDIGKPLPVDAFAAGPTWQSVGAAYYRRIAPLLEPTPELTQEAQALTAGLSDPVAKATAIYRHVQDSCRYLGLFRGIEGIIPATPEETQRTGYGDCKGLSSYIIALLRAVDIEAYPVLVLASDTDVLETTLPRTAQFNHYIAWADLGDDGLWIDGTVDAIPVGRVPPMDACSPVLFLAPGREGLREIPPTAWDPGDEEVQLRGSLTANGKLSTELLVERHREPSRRVRLNLREDPGAYSAQDLVEHYLGGELRLRGSEPTLSTPDDLAAPVQVNFACSSRAPLAFTRNRIFLPKELTPDHYLGLELVDRTADLDLRFMEDRADDWRVALPTGYALANPDSIVVTGPGLRWMREATQIGDSLVIRQSTLWENVLIPPSRLEELQTALEEIRTAQEGFYEISIP